MKTLSKRIASSMASFAATLVLGVAMSSPASAATTYTPGGGPSVNFVGSNVSFTFSYSDQMLTCTQFNLAGSVVNPGSSRAVGANGANFGTLSTPPCSNPIGGATPVTPTGAWGLTVVGSPVGTSWPVRVTNVSAQFSFAGCSVALAGTVSGSFDAATQRFTPVSGASGLKVAATPVGYLCPIWGFVNGEDVKVGGTWTNTPPAGSGPLTIAVP